MKSIDAAVRNVRNFWIELSVDGKQEEISAGPKGKDGGFFLRVLVREKGSVCPQIATLSGVVNAEGKLVIRCTMDQGLAPQEVKEFNGRISLVSAPIER
jgi:hypothetical protein